MSVIGESSDECVIDTLSWSDSSARRLRAAYNNAREVVRESLRPLKEQDEVRHRWREQIERG